LVVTHTTVPVEVKETFVGFLNKLVIAPAGIQPVANWEAALLPQGDAVHVRLLTPTREIRFTAREDYLGAVAITRAAALGTNGVVSRVDRTNGRIWIKRGRDRLKITLPADRIPSFVRRGRRVAVQPSRHTGAEPPAWISTD
jgi:hypothetical protein